MKNHLLILSTVITLSACGNPKSKNVSATQSTSSTQAGTYNGQTFTVAVYGTNATLNMGGKRYDLTQTDNPPVAVRCFCSIYVDKVGAIEVAIEGARSASIIKFDEPAERPASSTPTLYLNQSFLCKGVRGDNKTNFQISLIESPSKSAPRWIFQNEWSQLNTRDVNTYRITGNVGESSKNTLGYGRVDSSGDLTIFRVDDGLRLSMSTDHLIAEWMIDHTRSYNAQCFQN